METLQYNQTVVPYKLRCNNLLRYDISKNKEVNYLNTSDCYINT